MSQDCGGFSASGGTDLNLNEVKSMTIYVVLKHYDNNDNLYYDVSPFNLAGTISCHLKYHGFKEIFSFLRMSRLSERHAKKLAEKMNSSLSNR